MAINKIINSANKSHGALKKAIKYVMQENKIKDDFVCMSGPCNSSVLTTDSIYQDFITEKKNWKKDSGRMFVHSVISFHKMEKITPIQALQFGLDFAHNWFKGFQTLICVHQDRSHIHIHFITNTVNYIDGRKHHNSQKDLTKMKEYTNQMCRERGLTVAVKGKHLDGSPMEVGEVFSWNRNKYEMLKHNPQKSYVAACEKAVTGSLHHCKSKEEFIEKMSYNGWRVIWQDSKEHITFENKEGNKVRDDNLSKTYRIPISKKALLERFSDNSSGKDDMQDWQGPDLFIMSQHEKTSSIAERTLSQDKQKDQSRINLPTEENIHKKDKKKHKKKDECLDR